MICNISCSVVAHRIQLKTLQLINLKSGTMLIRIIFSSKYLTLYVVTCTYARKTRGVLLSLQLVISCLVICNLDSSLYLASSLRATSLNSCTPCYNYFYCTPLAASDIGSVYQRTDNKDFFYRRW